MLAETEATWGASGELASWLGGGPVGAADLPRPLSACILPLKVAPRPPKSAAGMLLGNMFFGSILPGLVDVRGAVF